MKAIELKEKVSLKDYLYTHNFSVKEYKKPFLCKFHEDHNPSAAIYNTNKGDFYICFACGVKGDIFDIVGLVENLPRFKDQYKFLKEMYENRT
ncbi:hypothetical protein KC678_01535 [Candidatus Dojkabacteria bacterium]|uniref:Zinc finger CHC2-type domain-containing protein n=1 Tax=Candidatus Dojkabacteria bacterium TaxID=2099670 RepID=A0A955IAA6_9BACT|nr:hypothetical protein [Candidatus Dojkabacteria bacterium]